LLKKVLASVTCALVAVSSLSFLPSSSKLGLLGADVVSAASETTTTTKPVTTKPTTTKPTTTKKPTTKKPTTTKTTTKTTTATNSTKLLKLGSKGNDVKLLQTTLNKNGYKLTVDGIFGKKTLSAVKGYQKKNSLKVDGLVGPKTNGKLYPKVATPAKPATPATPAKPVVVEPNFDAITAASITGDALVFEKSIGKNGKWIIATTKDITTTRPLVLEGEFLNSRNAVQRKIAPYTQDENKVVLERFTITAPKLTIKSPNARIQSGTFVGDIYVETLGFQLVDAKVQGNVYFANQKIKDSFVADTKSSITGKQEILAVDTVTAPSIEIKNETDLQKSLSYNGKWITTIGGDLKTDKNLVMEGNTLGKADATGKVTTPGRKLGLYNYVYDAAGVRLKDAAGKNLEVHYTLTAPSLTIKSANSKIQYGTFVGDIYVSAPKFTLQDVTVKGNVYFTTQEAKDTFTVTSKTVITGKEELKLN
jgi:peptidoglycan hydrolase-like protein with peptidoglycan-binding domain